MTTFRACSLCKRRNNYFLRSYHTGIASSESSKFRTNETRQRCFEDEYKQTHVTTNSFQKLLLSAGAATISILNPRRADMIAVLGETTGDYARNFIKDKMMESEEGRQILEEKPRINSKTVDLKVLDTLPEGTLGKTYSNFLKDNKVTPDSRNRVQFVDDLELAYVVQRYREVHDLFHTVLDMPTNMLGEVTVKWVEAIQTRLPMCIGGALFGAVRLAPKYHISQRYYSTKSKYNVDEDALQPGLDKQTKGFKHKGVMNIPPVVIPLEIQDRIANLFETQSVKQLIPHAEYLERYLNCRKAPSEEVHYDSVAKEGLDNFLKKHPVDDTQLSEKMLKIYTKKKTRFINNFIANKIYHWKAIEYNDYNSLLYLIAKSAQNYAVVFKILTEISKRDPDFRPKSMFDFGSGVGTCSWAAWSLWKDSLAEYYCVDSSSSVQDLAMAILNNNDVNNKPFIQTLYQRQFLPELNRPYDIVFSCYSLMELFSQSNRLEVLTNLWNKTQGYLILVEVGTNAGYHLINEARDYILHIDKNCHIFAPCTHESSCPRFTDKTPCNFYVKYEPLKILRQPIPKVELYSYVVFKKGDRTESKWSRIVRPVLLRHNHSVCKLCTGNGKLEQIFISKSNSSKTVYKCAKKSHWGDLLPCNISEEYVSDSDGE